jgi:RNA polymerase sigma-70 factor (ECF subfamily)
MTTGRITTGAAPPEDGDRRFFSAGSTSRSLLAAAREHHPAAWTRLVALYSPLVAAWCTRWGVARQDVLDVVQDVFTAVAANLERFRKERPGDTFRGWLATIARNKVHDYFRRNAGAPAAAGGTEAWLRISQVCDGHSLKSESEDVAAEIFSEVLSRALESIRGEFQEQTWQAFWRTVVEGRAAIDVASELGMQARAVRVSKSRVLCRLRQELGDEPPPEQRCTLQSGPGFLAGVARPVGLPDLPLSGHGHGRHDLSGHPAPAAAMVSCGLADPEPEKRS